MDGILAAVAGTRWEKVLAPLQSAKPDRGLTAQAEPLLQDFRHRALVALAPAKSGTSAAPNLRDLVELECDTSAVSNAARLIRIGAPDSVVRTNARRDCTALTNDEWEYLLAARDPAQAKIDELNQTIADNQAYLDANAPQPEETAQPEATEAPAE